MYVLAAELHCHSRHSIDGVASVEELLSQASAVGLDVIAVTDHDTVEGGHRAVDLAPEYGLVAIPGMEVTSAAGHVLALGVDSPVPAGLFFHETVERIHEQGGVAVVPHPYYGRLRDAVLVDIEPRDLVAADAIEAYNSRFVTGRANQQARHLAVDLGMPVTAGSDAHVASMVGRTVTRVDADRSEPDAVLSAIVDGRTEIVGRQTPLHAWVDQVTGTASRHARNGLQWLR